MGLGGGNWWGWGANWWGWGGQLVGLADWWGWGGQLVGMGMEGVNRWGGG